MRTVPRLACVLLLVVAGCSSSGAGPARIAWSRVEVTAPSLLAPGADGSLLIAEDGGVEASPLPRVLRLRDGAAEPVPVVASSYYGERTVWHGLAEHADRLLAFGGRSGGAHGNIRWTAWAGRSRLREDVQSFETFGGTRAGGLSALVVTSSGTPLIIGSRVSPTASGLDLAVWDLVGRRWVMRSSAGTVLAADATQQPAAHGAAARGEGVVISGSITQFGGGGPRTRPAIWWSASSAGPWRRVLLPASAGTVTEAQAVACDPDGNCTVVGTSDGHLVGWALDSDDAVSRLPLPAVAADPGAVFVARDGAGHRVVGASASDRSRIFSGGRTWSAGTAPRGALAGLAVAGGRVWILTRAQAGNRLWFTDL